MKPKQVSHIVDTAKIVSDPTRVKILYALQEQEDMCVYEIAEAVRASHSAVSHQLAKLESLEIVSCYRDGQRMCYELSGSKSAKEVLDMLKYLRG